MRLGLWIACAALVACKPTSPPRVPSRLDVRNDSVCVDDGDAVRCIGFGAGPASEAPLDPSAERLFFACTRADAEHMRCALPEPELWPLPAVTRPWTATSERCLVGRRGEYACMALDRAWKQPLAISPVRDALGIVEDGCLLDGAGILSCWTGEREPTVTQPLGGRKNLRRLAAGSQPGSGCAIADGGDLVCWDTAGPYIRWPTRLWGPVRAAALGSHHGCALLDDGRVACFGDNCRGQLGTGDRRSSQEAVIVPGLADIVEVTASRDSSCALARDGSLWCWGRAGARTDPRSGPRTRPTPVAGLDHAVALAVAGDRSCAVTADGAVLCWGDRHAGPGALERCPAYEPTRLDQIEAAVDITMGSTTGCVRHPSGRASCWQYDPAAATRTTGIVLPGVYDNLSAGTGHVCGLDRAGVVHCLRLGGGAPPGEPPSSITIPLPGPAVQLDVTDARACAVTQTGSVHCWSLTAAHDLGAKVEALPFTDAVEVALGGDEATCARTQGGRVACIGELPAPAEQIAALTGVRRLALGYAGLCVVTEGDEVRCLGPLHPVELDVRTRHLGLGDDHACALGDDGRVRCWGEQHDGALGDGHVPFAPAPVQLRGPTRAPK